MVVAIPRAFGVLAASVAIAAATNAPPAVRDAQRAARAGDYRVFTLSGLAFKQAPGLICTTPEALARLPSRGGAVVSDVHGERMKPGGEPANLEASVAFNRALGSDRGFQSKTGCRAQSRCELRFQTPHIAKSLGAPFAPGEGIDRACLHEPAQLATLAAAGAPADLRAMLRRPQAAWRGRDFQSLDAYDRALIAAAGAARPDTVALLLPAVRPPGRPPATAPMTVLERALVTALVPRRQAPGVDVVAVVAQLLDAGGRLEFRRDGRVVSLLRVVVEQTGPTQSDRARLVELLLARGADPNGPGCHPRPDGEGALDRGLPPIAGLAPADIAFAPLQRAGARPQQPPCRAAKVVGTRR